MTERESGHKIRSVVRDALEGVGLDEGDHRMAILAGAGASLGSGLPTAPALARTLLEETGLAPEQIQEILKRDLPLERLIQTILTEVSEPGLLDLFALGGPSRLHRAVAELWAARIIDSVYTTNFDEHFEGAMTRVRAIRSYVRSVAGVDDVPTGHFEPSLSGHVVKLHGTVSEPSSLKATITAVGQGLSRSSIVAPLAELFVSGRHELVVSLGYSFSDHFDINPILEGLTCEKPVIMLRHSAQVAGPVGTQSLGEEHPLSRVRGVILMGPPAEMLIHLGRACGFAPDLELGAEPTPADWQTGLKGWFGQQGAWRLPISGLLRANLLLNAGGEEAAFAEFMAGHRVATTFVLPKDHAVGEAEQIPRMEAMYLWGIFRTSEDRIPDERRLELLTRCLVLIENEGRPFEVANVLAALGTLERRLGNVSAARRHLEQAIDRCGGLPDSAKNIAAFIQLSEIFRDEGKSVETTRLLRVALRLAEARGSLDQAAGTLARLADMASLGGDDDGAQSLANQARRLAAGLKNPILLASLEKWQPGGSRHRRN